MTEKRGDGEGAGSVTGRVIGLVALRGPMHLCVCVIKEGGDGKGAGSQSLSDTFRYINLAGLTTGLVTLRGPILFSLEGGDGHWAHFFFLPQVQFQTDMQADMKNIAGGKEKEKSEVEGDETIKSPRKIEVRSRATDKNDRDEGQRKRMTAVCAC